MARLSAAHAKAGSRSSVNVSCRRLCVYCTKGLKSNVGLDGESQTW
jgi:hypothetical protein